MRRSLDASAWTDEQNVWHHELVRMQLNTHTFPLSAAVKTQTTGTPAKLCSLYWWMLRRKIHFNNLLAEVSRATKKYYFKMEGESCTGQSCFGTPCDGPRTWRRNGFYSKRDAEGKRRPRPPVLSRWCNAHMRE